MRPILAFREYVFSDVLPSFNNIGERARQIGEAEYKRIGALSAYGDDFDMSDAAEAAQEYSLSWYQMMTSLRQSMRNLLAAGLFHLAEQQLGKFCQDVGFLRTPPLNTNLMEIANWFRDVVELDLKGLPTWAMMEELKLVANTVKHAEGDSSTKLLALREDLFSNPDYREIYEAHREYGSDLPRGPVVAPLAGEDLFITDDVLRSYADGVIAFFHGYHRLLQ